MSQQHRMPASAFAIYVVFAVSILTAVGAEPREGLMAVFDACGGANWQNANGWGSAASVCTWGGVSCQGTAVVGLALGGVGLACSDFPWASALPSLSSTLQLLDLSRNPQLLGSLPEGLPQLLPLLQLFSVAHTGISGTMPRDIGNAPWRTSIEVLTLSSAAVVGTIPASISLMSGLQQLSLDGIDGLIGSFDAVYLPSAAAVNFSGDENIVSCAYVKNTVTLTLDVQTTTFELLAKPQTPNYVPQGLYVMETPSSHSSSGPSGTASSFRILSDVVFAGESMPVPGGATPPLQCAVHFASVGITEPLLLDAETDYISHYMYLNEALSPCLVPPSEGLLIMPFFSVADGGSIVYQTANSDGSPGPGIAFSFTPLINLTDTVVIACASTPSGFYTVSFQWDRVVVGSVRWSDGATATATFVGEVLLNATNNVVINSNAVMEAVIAAFASEANVNTACTWVVTEPDTVSLQCSESTYEFSLSTCDACLVESLKHAETCSRCFRFPGSFGVCELQVSAAAGLWSGLVNSGEALLPVQGIATSVLSFQALLVAAVAALPAGSSWRAALLPLVANRHAVPLPHCPALKVLPFSYCGLTNIGASVFFSMALGCLDRSEPCVSVTAVAATSSGVSYVSVELATVPRFIKYESSGSGSSSSSSATSSATYYLLNATSVLATLSVLLPENVAVSAVNVTIGGDNDETMSFVDATDAPLLTWTASDCDATISSVFGAKTASDKSAAGSSTASWCLEGPSFASLEYSLRQNVDQPPDVNFTLRNPLMTSYASEPFIAAPVLNPVFAWYAYTQSLSFPGGRLPWSRFQAANSELCETPLHQVSGAFCFNIGTPASFLTLLFSAGDGNSPQGSFVGTSATSYPGAVQSARVEETLYTIPANGSVVNATSIVAAIASLHFPLFASRTIVALAYDAEAGTITLTFSDSTHYAVSGSSCDACLVQSATTSASAMPCTSCYSVVHGAYNISSIVNATVDPATQDAVLVANFGSEQTVVPLSTFGSDRYVFDFNFLVELVLLQSMPLPFQGPVSTVTQLPDCPTPIQLSGIMCYGTATEFSTLVFTNEGNSFGGRAIVTNEPSITMSNVSVGRWLFPVNPLTLEVANATTFLETLADALPGVLRQAAADNDEVEIFYDSLASSLDFVLVSIGVNITMSSAQCDPCAATTVFAAFENAGGSHSPCVSCWLSSANTLLQSTLMTTKTQISYTIGLEDSEGHLTDRTMSSVALPLRSASAFPVLGNSTLLTLLFVLDELSLSQVQEYFPSGQRQAAKCPTPQLLTTSRLCGWRASYFVSVIVNTSGDALLTSEDVSPGAAISTAVPVAQRPSTPIALIEWGGQQVVANVSSLLSSVLHTARWRSEILGFEAATVALDVTGGSGTLIATTMTIQNVGGSSSAVFTSSACDTQLADVLSGSDESVVFCFLDAVGDLYTLNVSGGEEPSVTASVNERVFVDRAVTSLDEVLNGTALMAAVATELSSLYMVPSFEAISCEHLHPQPLSGVYCGAGRDGAALTLALGNTTQRGVRFLNSALVTASSSLEGGWLVLPGADNETKFLLNSSGFLAVFGDVLGVSSGELSSCQQVELAANGDMSVMCGNTSVVVSPTRCDAQLAMLIQKIVDGTVPPAKPGSAFSASVTLCDISTTDWIPREITIGVSATESASLLMVVTTTGTNGSVTEGPHPVPLLGNVTVLVGPVMRWLHAEFQVAVSAEAHAAMTPVSCAAIAATSVGTSTFCGFSLPTGPAINANRSGYFTFVEASENQSSIGVLVAASVDAASGAANTSSASSTSAFVLQVLPAFGGLIVNQSWFAESFRSALAPWLPVAAVSNASVNGGRLTVLVAGNEMVFLSSACDPCLVGALAVSSTEPGRLCTACFVGAHDYLSFSVVAGGSYINHKVVWNKNFMSSDASVDASDFGGLGSMWIYNWEPLAAVALTLVDDNVASLQPTLCQTPGALYGAYCASNGTRNYTSIVFGTSSVVASRTSWNASGGTLSQPSYTTVSVFVPDTTFFFLPWNDNTIVNGTGLAGAVASVFVKDGGSSIVFSNASLSEDNSTLTLAYAVESNGTSAVVSVVLHQGACDLCLSTLMAATLPSDKPSLHAGGGTDRERPAPTTAHLQRSGVPPTGQKSCNFCWIEESTFQVLNFTVLGEMAPMSSELGWTLTAVNASGEFSTGSTALHSKLLATLPYVPIAAVLVDSVIQATSQAAIGMALPVLSELNATSCSATIIAPPASGTACGVIGNSTFVCLTASNGSITVTVTNATASISIPSGTSSCVMEQFDLRAVNGTMWMDEVELLLRLTRVIQDVVSEEWKDAFNASRVQFSLSYTGGALSLYFVDRSDGSALLVMSSEQCSAELVSVFASPALANETGESCLLSSDLSLLKLTVSRDAVSFTFNNATGWWWRVLVAGGGSGSGDGGSGEPSLWSWYSDVATHTYAFPALAAVAQRMFIALPSSVSVSEPALTAGMPLPPLVELLTLNGGSAVAPSFLCDSVVVTRSVDVAAYDAYAGALCLGNPMNTTNSFPANVLNATLYPRSVTATGNTDALLAVATAVEVPGLPSQRDVSSAATRLQTFQQGMSWIQTTLTSPSWLVDALTSPAGSLLLNQTLQREAFCDFLGDVPQHSCAADWVFGVGHAGVPIVIEASLRRSSGAPVKLFEACELFQQNVVSHCLLRAFANPVPLNNCSDCLEVSPGTATSAFYFMRTQPTDNEVLNVEVTTPGEAFPPFHLQLADSKLWRYLLPVVTTFFALVHNDTAASVIPTNCSQSPQPVPRASYCGSFWTPSGLGVANMTVAFLALTTGGESQGISTVTSSTRHVSLENFPADLLSRDAGVSVNGATSNASLYYVIESAALQWIPLESTSSLLAAAQPVLPELRSDGAPLPLSSAAVMFFSPYDNAGGGFAFLSSNPAVNLTLREGYCDACLVPLLQGAGVGGASTTCVYALLTQNGDVYDWNVTALPEAGGGGSTALFQFTLVQHLLNTTTGNEARVLSWTSSADDTAVLAALPDPLALLSFVSSRAGVGGTIVPGMLPYAVQQASWLSNQTHGRIAWQRAGARSALCGTGPNGRTVFIAYDVASGCSAQPLTSCSGTLSMRVVDGDQTMYVQQVNVSLIAINASSPLFTQHASEFLRVVSNPANSDGWSFTNTTAFQAFVKVFGDANGELVVSDQVNLFGIFEGTLEALGILPNATNTTNAHLVATFDGTRFTSIAVVAVGDERGAGPRAVLNVTQGACSACIVESYIDGKDGSTCPPTMYLSEVSALFYQVFVSAKRVLINKMMPTLKSGFAGNAEAVVALDMPSSVFPWFFNESLLAVTLQMPEIAYLLRDASVTGSAEYTIIPPSSFCYTVESFSYTLTLSAPSGPDNSSSASLTRFQLPSGTNYVTGSYSYPFAFIVVRLGQLLADIYGITAALGTVFPKYTLNGELVGPINSGSYSTFGTPQIAFYDTNISTQVSFLAGASCKAIASCWPIGLLTGDGQSGNDASSAMSGGTDNIPSSYAESVVGSSAVHTVLWSGGGAWNPIGFSRINSPMPLRSLMAPLWPSSVQPCGSAAAPCKLPCITQSSPTCGQVAGESVAVFLYSYVTTGNLSAAVELFGACNDTTDHDEIGDPTAFGMYGPLAFSEESNSSNYTPSTDAWIRKSVESFSRNPIVELKCSHDGTVVVMSSVPQSDDEAPMLLMVLPSAGASLQVSSTSTNSSFFDVAMTCSSCIPYVLPTNNPQPIFFLFFSAIKTLIVTLLAFYAARNCHCLVDRIVLHGIAGIAASLARIDVHHEDAFKRKVHANYLPPRCSNKKLRRRLERVIAAYDALRRQQSGNTASAGGVSLQRSDEVLTEFVLYYEACLADDRRRIPRPPKSARKKAPAAASPDQQRPPLSYGAASVVQGTEINRDSFDTRDVCSEEVVESLGCICDLLAARMATRRALRSASKRQQRQGKSRLADVAAQQAGAAAVNIEGEGVAPTTYFSASAIAPPDGTSDSDSDEDIPNAGLASSLHLQPVHRREASGISNTSLVEMATPTSRSKLFLSNGVASGSRWYDRFASGRLAPTSERPKSPSQEPTRSSVQDILQATSADLSERLERIEAELSSETNRAVEMFSRTADSFERVLLTSRVLDDALTPVGWMLVLDAVYCLIIFALSLADISRVKKESPGVSTLELYESLYFKLLNSSAMSSFMVSSWVAATLQRKPLLSNKTFLISIALVCPPLLTHVVPALVLFAPVLVVPLAGGIGFELWTRRRFAVHYQRPSASSQTEGLESATTEGAHVSVHNGSRAFTTPSAGSTYRQFEESSPLSPSVADDETSDEEELSRVEDQDRGQLLVSFAARATSRVLINFAAAVVLSMAFNLSILYVYHNGARGNPTSYWSVVELEFTSRNLVCTVNGLGTSVATLLQSLSAIGPAFF